MKTLIRGRSVLRFLALQSFFALNLWASTVVTSSPYATEAALEILHAGGNATDAMVAATFALSVTQPYKLGIGGGGFYLIASKGKVHLVNYRETAPDSVTPEMFLSSGKAIPYSPERITGPNPVGVPGTVAGLYEAHKNWGKLEWAKLLAPAVRLSERGFPITEKFQNDLGKNWERISAFPVTASVFGDGEGSFLKMGHLLKQASLAETLRKIARDPLSFYRGDLAQSWISEAQKLGVKITLKDLADYRVRNDKPVHYTFHGFDAYTAALPSSSGITVAGPLRFLENYYRTHDVPAPESAERVIVTSEAMRFFQDLRDENLADTPDSKIDPQKFLSSPEEKSAWKTIEKQIQARMDRIQTGVANLPNRHLENAAKLASETGVQRGHTAHLSIVDDQGMAVSHTSTIEELFGSGIVVPKHGFLLNNELSDFTAEPTGHPNAPKPGKRPRSNMSPTLFLHQGNPVAILGCAGGFRIPSAITVFAENYYLHKLDARAALAMPRFNPTAKRLELEESFSKLTQERLKEAGYTLDIQKTLWTVAEVAVRRNSKSGWEAAADPRYDGMGITLPSRNGKIAK